MSREHFDPRFYDHFANRDQGSRVRAAMMMDNAASFSSVTPADISTVNTGYSEKPSGRVIKILGPLAVPFLIAACSSAPSQPQVRQIESSPTVPISTPATLPTEKPTSTATPEICDPAKFAKEQGVPTPYPRGSGGEGNNELFLQAVEISKKLQRCEKLTPEETAIIVQYNLKYDVKSSEPAPAAKPAATATAPATAAPKPTPIEATSTPKPPEKSPLPTYGVFMGDLGGDGMIVVASIPETDTSDSVLVYFMRSEGKGYSYMIFKAKAENIQAGTFQVLLSPPGRLWRLQATLGETGKALSGKIEYGRPEAVPNWESDFNVDFTGTGKAKVIEDIKRVKASVSKLGNVDLSAVKLDELKDRLDVDKLP